MVVGGVGTRSNPNKNDKEHAVKHKAKAPV